jgi:signal transduction histidine kinase
MVARLAGGVAHNFNNLILAINGNAEFVAATLPPDDPRLADLGAIEEAGARAAHLTRVLLEFGRRSEGPPARIEVDAAVGSVVTLLTATAPEVTVRPGAPGATVLIAPDGLREVIATLVLRAREVTPPDGRVRLATVVDEVGRADRRRPATASPGRYWRVSVTDEGPAIPVDRLGNVFDPFYSAREGDWSPDVGLSGVAGIVAGAGGFVLAEAGPGTGTTLSAFLPLAEPVEPA